MASQQYLSKSGLSRLWYQVSNQFVKKEDGKGLFSGSYTDLTNTPTNVSEFTNDAGYAVAQDVADTYLTQQDAATTYVTLEAYNEKVAALEQADTDNLAAAKEYADTQDATLTETLEKYADDGDAATLTSAKDYVDEAVGAITGFDFQIVDALPDEGVKGVIYLVAAEEGDNVDADDNVYSEYLWIKASEDDAGSFELIGSTKMDLTGYLKEVDITYITNDEIDEICAAADSTANSGSDATETTDGQDTTPTDNQTEDTGSTPTGDDNQDSDGGEQS
jgi:hypothetical protein